MSNRIPTKPHDTAFPCHEDLYDAGMSIREYFAAKAMQGILTTQTKAAIDSGMWLADESIAAKSVRMADALIKALNADI